MAGSVVVSRWMVSEKMESFDDSDQVHVLAVDDSLVDRKVIERLLKITSCKVTAVDSGRRALQFLGLDEEEEQSPAISGGLKVDMVITDYCMPEMTGYELLKKIKESSTFREIPVVIMSSENVGSRIDSCLEEGAEDFIVKPVKLADVKRLRDYMTKEPKSPTNKRKKVPEPAPEPEVCVCESDDSTLSSSPPLSILSTTSSESSSPPSISSTASSKTSSPSSPAPLDSPIRRLKMTELL